MEMKPKLLFQFIHKLDKQIEFSRENPLVSWLVTAYQRALKR